MRKTTMLLLAEFALLSALWSWGHKPVPVPLPDSTTPTGTVAPEQPDPRLAAIFAAIEAHCYVVSDDPMTVMFLADDGTFQIGSDCFSAFQAWHALKPPRPLSVA